METVRKALERERERERERGERVGNVILLLCYSIVK